MTDQENKTEIIKKHFFKTCENFGMKQEESEKDYKNFLKEKELVHMINTCMEEWAGVISKRVEEEIRDEYET